MRTVVRTQHLKVPIEIDESLVGVPIQQILDFRKLVDECDVFAMKTLEVNLPEWVKIVN